MAKSYLGVIRHYDNKSKETKDFFHHLPSLVTSMENYPWQIIIAYLFIQVETAQHRVLYGGIRKVHKAHKEVTESCMSKMHLTRQSFLDLFERIYGTPLPLSIASKIKTAERIRDMSVHGKEVAETDARLAIIDILDYAEDLGQHIQKIARFNPCGDMRGLTGRSEPLSKESTRWLLKGLGII